MGSWNLLPLEGLLASIRSHAPGLIILNLSLYNILSTVINVPTTLLALFRNQKPFGNTCSVASFADTFLITNAMLSMAALGVDRWAAVTFPLTYASTFTCSRWNPGSPSSPWGFTALLVLCVTYMKVLTVARFHCNDVITVQTLLVHVDIHPSVKQRCVMEQKRRRQRATKKVCVFIGSFVFCFTPYVLTRLAELIPSVKINPHWGVISKCLVYSKAAMDPFVYSLLRQEYRKAIIGMTNTHMGRKRSYYFDYNSTTYTENDHKLKAVSSAAWEARRKEENLEAVI
ncbi:G-protein coupled receptor 26 [Tachysurus ichikawai]